MDLNRRALAIHTDEGKVLSALQGAPEDTHIREGKALNASKRPAPGHQRKREKQPREHCGELGQIVDTPEGQGLKALRRLDPGAL